MNNCRNKPSAESDSSSAAMDTEPPPTTTAPGCVPAHVISAKNEVHPQVRSALDNFLKEQSNHASTTLTIGGVCPSTRARLHLLDVATVEHLINHFKNNSNQYAISKVRFCCSVDPTDGETMNRATELLRILGSTTALEMHSSSSLEHCPAQDKCDAALLDCVRLGAIASPLHDLSLVGFDWSCLGRSWEAMINLLQSLSGKPVESLEWHECVFPKVVFSRELSLCLAQMHDLHSVSWQLCDIPSGTMVRLLDSLTQQQCLRHLSLYKCAGVGGTNVLNALNRLLESVPLQYLMLAETRTAQPLLESPMAKEAFLKTLQVNDSLVQLRLTTRGGAFRLHRQVQALMKRNRLHCAVRTSLHETVHATLPVTAWSSGLATLAQAQQPSAMYLALSSLAPPLGALSSSSH
mmetsp:Transcript_16526/g.34094  ORF Transcript_16526/g.34094 Transcript_16526/m.34094 type:complete len:407 (-) Transcript_16526:890-2110(-)